MKVGDRVRVKERHRLRGVVAAIDDDANPLTDYNPAIEVDLDGDDFDAPVIYLADEVEPESKPCACVWCKGAPTL